MAILVSDILTAGDYFRRSAETVELTSAKQLEAAALAIEDVHSQALFRFTQRKQTLDYLESETDYSLLEALNIQDFRAPKDLRKRDDNTFGFDYIDPNQFAVSQARYPDRCNYTIEFLDGQPILRLSQTGFGTTTQIHTASDFDSNGTWAVANDATNIATDSYIYRNHGGSIKFDTTGAGTTATVSVSDMTAVDLTNYKDHGIIRMWVYIPDVLDDTSLYVTSVELRWGSDASNYWSNTVTRPVDNYTFTDRWNLLEFKWNESVETGTVDETAIGYLLVKFTYGAGQPADTGFRINDIRIYEPVEMEFVYFSSSTVKTTSTNIWKARATATTDILLAPDIYKPVYVSAYNYYVSHLIYPADDKRIDMYERRYGLIDPNSGKRTGGMIGRLIKEMGEREKIALRKLTPGVSWSGD